MTMTPINPVSSIGINLLASLLYDIGKHVWKNLHKPDITQETIIEYINNHVSEKCKDIIDSYSFQKYISSSQVRELINDYVKLKIYSDYMADASRLMRRFAVKSSVVAYSDLIDSLSKQLLQVYSENAHDTICAIPDSKTIKESIEELLRLMCEFFSNTLSDETKISVLLVNEHTDKNFMILLNSIKWLNEKIDQVLSSFDEIQSVTTDYSQLLNSYLQRIKSLSSTERVYLLGKYDLGVFYVCPELYYEGKDTIKEFGSLFASNDIDGYRMTQTNWQNIFNVNSIVYIIGGPGYGKSLFLQYIIGQYESMNILDADTRLVIYGRLSDFKQNTQNGELSVVEYLQQCMIRMTGMDKTELSKEFINAYINQGKCLILLDALDEVPNSLREELHKKLISFFRSNNPNNKICITTRSRGFVPESDIHTFSILPISENQIEEYVEKMINLGKFDAEDKDRFLRQAISMIKSHFLTSFLTLSLLVAIFNAEQELPDTKLKLYEKCFEYIAMKREKDKKTDYNWGIMTTILSDNTFMELSNLGAPNNSSIDKENIMKCLLESYGGDYPSRNDARNAINEFLKFCGERTEVFVPAEADDRYKFFHRSFYEYFYSKFLVMRCNTAEDLYKRLIIIDLDSEIFELVIAMLKKEAVQKCNRLMLLLCDKAEIDLGSEDPQFNEFNVLGLTISLVSNLEIQDRVIKILLDNVEIIVNGINRIITGDKLYLFLKSKPEFIEKTIEAYKNYAYKEISDRVVKAMDTYNSMFHSSIKEVRKIKFGALFILTQFVGRYSFYTQLIIDQRGMENVLLDVNHWLRNQYSKTKSGSKNLRRVTGKILQAIDFYNTFNNEIELNYRDLGEIITNDLTQKEDTKGGT